MLNFVSIYSAVGQIRTKYKIYNQNNFEKNKVFENTYHLWSSKDTLGFIVKDTLSYFVDDRKYKGIINYGIEYRSKDFRNFYFFENFTMCFLRINIEKSRYNANDSIIDIEGYVNGGWGDLAKTGKNKPKNFIHVFIGEKTDTISACYLRKYVNNEYIETRLNNKIIDNNHILDSFSSFYFKKYSYFKTISKGNRPFKISAKINENSIIAFGSSGCYSEIFDIGSMVFFSKKNKRTKNAKKQELQSKQLIINNKLVSDIEKEKTQKEEINYYTYTEKAEQFILRRQFAKAKEEYIVLFQNYPTQFARDIHNAIRCAILSRDLKTAFVWGKKLADKGVKISYFNSKIFNPLKRSVDWKNFSTQYDSIYNINQKKINRNLKAQIEELLNEDQADYGLENRKEPKVLFETTERVTDKFIELLKKEGFPSEEKIGVFMKNDSIISFFPDYNVIIRHAVQQYPSKLKELMEILDKASDSLVYDKKRSTNHIGFVGACFQIYKGNLYNAKSCGNNEMMVKKISFIFNNPNKFIIDSGDYIVSEYNNENPEEYDKYYNENFNLIKKLTDDWEFYEK